MSYYLVVAIILVILTFYNITSTKEFWNKNKIWIIL